MAYKCDNCDKGKSTGHMVSHAKNRLKRIFIPNLQKLKVLQNGAVIRVKFCTSCIKRLYKDGRIGTYSRMLAVSAVAEKETPVESVVEKILAQSKVKEEKGLKIKKAKAREALDISAIVGKKN